MKRLETLALTALISCSAFSSEKTDKSWKQQLALEGLAAKDQSYCYTNEKGDIEGVNVDMRVRLASVSKLLVTLWAIEKLGPEHKYDTKLFIKNKSLHIAGSYDPFLGDEKMFFLISELNELGIEEFETITFDKNLLVNPNAQFYSDDYPVMNATTNAKNLKKYFNTRSWSTDTKSAYNTYFEMAKAGQYRKEVKFSASDIKFVETNPFENDQEVKVLTLSSPALHKYLKEMNVKSNNYVAETIYRQLGSNAEFEKFLFEKYKLTSEEIYFYTGSGLPAFINGQRKDNYASCTVVLNLINDLKSSVEKQGKELEKIIAVPGSDKGTFRNRIFPLDYKNSFMAKTGTLMHTSTLAGAMNTQKGFSFFGIFNQSTDIAGSKKVQNAMVASIMHDMGGPKAFDYVVDGFHTYGPERVKKLLEDDFSSIAEGLF